MFEELFNASVLDVAVPDTSVEYPPRTDTDDWLKRLKAGPTERKQAFFDEQLQFFLTVRIDNPSPDAPTDPEHPPADLLGFLSHLQVSLEATYISSVPVNVPDTPRLARISAPPRTTSFARFNDSLHPNMIPPSTPNPTPSTADRDRRYVRSEGTLLLASIWGQDASENSCEAFSLLWSQEERAWVAVYRLSVTVSFLRLAFADPLLCLTVSQTLRDKPLVSTQPSHPLTAFLTAHNALPAPTELPPPTPIDDTDTTPADQFEINGLEEINLLEGLSSGPTFSTTGSDRLCLSTTRLGGVTRRRLFSLPPVVPALPPVPSPAPSTARIAQATLRKSFRKTLETVSGFRVRMRTVFVPYVLLPEANDTIDPDDILDERERREAGNEERTVVLCVEVENSGESGRGVGFAVEAVDVKIGGEGAKTVLIGWEEGGFADSVERGTFPLLVGPMEQYNLLYAVSFLRSPEDTDTFSLNKRDSTATTKRGDPPTTVLQRAVTINIQGKPYLRAHSALDGDIHPPVSRRSIVVASAVSFPTQSFSSRWNCVLDLSAQQHLGIAELHDDVGVGNNNALPEPASPFPTFSPRMSSAIPVNSAFVPTPSPQLAVAGSKRHTLSEYSPGRLIKSATPTYYQTPTTPSLLNPNSQQSRERASVTPSKLSSTSSLVPYPPTPTTYALPPSVESDDGAGYDSPSSTTHNPILKPPLTPAYPAYPSHSALPPTPHSSAPIANLSGGVGPSVEIRRERGAVAGLGAGVPQTPAPTIATGIGGRGMMRVIKGVAEEEERGSIVVSVGMLPPVSDAQKTGERICPLDQFTLDIFVYNQSMWTRRFEVSFPYRRRRRKQEERHEVGGTGGAKSASAFPGIIPLDNRVRVGPLRPATCQSVRMEFLAVVPGVHTIDVLTLTDVESGFAMNLRSVMDVVVHERND